MTVEEQVRASYPAAVLVAENHPGKRSLAYRVEEPATGKILGNWRTLPDWAWQAALRRLRRQKARGKVARLQNPEIPRPVNTPSSFFQE